MYISYDQTQQVIINNTSNVGPKLNVIMHCNEAQGLNTPIEIQLLASS